MEIINEANQIIISIMNSSEPQKISEQEITSLLEIIDNEDTAEWSKYVKGINI